MHNSSKSIKSSVYVLVDCPCTLARKATHIPFGPSWPSLLDHSFWTDVHKAHDFKDTIECAVYSQITVSTLIFEPIYVCATEHRVFAGRSNALSVTRHLRKS